MGIHKLFILSVLFLSSPAFATQIVLIAGGPVDFQTAGFKELESTVRQLSRSYPQVTLKSVHNSKWKGLCQELEGPKEESLILIGHSWGAQAAVDISRCFSERKIDLAILIDWIFKPFREDNEIIPERTIDLFNFYQRDGLIFKGFENPRRSDGSVRGIHSERIHLQADSNPHDSIIDRLIEDNRIQEILHAYLQELDEKR